jgi:DNA-binding transcriptional MerR regulator
MSASFRIGDLAKQTGVKVVTIRFYEQSRLLPACERTAGNYRVYGQNHLQRLRFVRRCRELGFSVDRSGSFSTFLQQNCLHAQTYAV